MIRTASLVRLLLLALLAATATCRDAATQQPTDPIRYGRDVRPILSDRCFRCHGPDAGTRKAGLRLDLRDAALAAHDDGAAIVPGAPQQSLLLDRVTAHDSDERMPPPDSGKPALTAEEIELLRRWITEGAVYESHWAFSPPQRPPVPAPAGRQATGNAIDAFLAAARHSRALTASPPADRSTQARRLYLVLTGLPPTPEELRTFLDDSRPDAYELLVDQLLGEEPYRSRHAEHLAGIWLDAGRYADTSGIHMDAGRQAWLWRDWLLRALREDQPFDQFVLEQLAGDLLPEGTAEQRIATGFLRNHVTTDEGGAINEEYLVEYAAERTETVGRVFLGLSVGCARCHDHKYDPLRQEDYYSLFAFFNNNEEPGLYSQSQNANRALEPFLPVPTETQEQQQQRLDGEIAAAEASLAVTTPVEQREYDDFLRGLPDAIGVHWQTAQVLAAETRDSSTLTIGVDATVRNSGDNPARSQHVITLAATGDAQRWLSIEALPDPSASHHRVGRAPNGNAVLSHVRLEQRGPDAEWHEVPLCYALADVEQTDGDFRVGNLLHDDENGWAVGAFLTEPGPRAVMLLAGEPFGGELRVTLSYQSIYSQHTFGRVRFATSAASEKGLARLPLSQSGFHTVGPFVGPFVGPAVGPDAGGSAAQPASNEDLYTGPFGPEQAPFDRDAKFGPLSWRYDRNATSAKANPLAGDRGVTFVAQRLWSPDARSCEVSLGSDDGFRLFLDGVLVGERRVDRGVAVDQDRVKLQLSAGEHHLLLQIVNTGGAGGFALRHVPNADELLPDLCLPLLANGTADLLRSDRVAAAFRDAFSPTRLAGVQQLAQLREQRMAVDAAVPRAMVMQERNAMRDTFVLTRGEYDQPDASRQVTRNIPAMFGTMADDLPRNRLGLARWLVSEQNPLLHRVMANRLWEFVFGTGIVRTSDDFGLQGDWPSHPELLDWLACELRDNGHSVRQLLRLLVTSDAFRQDSCCGSGAAIDPQDRYLSWFPRRRLSAEVIRDQALYLGDLLVERFGGASVKPYQPPGLWREVAMLQSNTRTFQRDEGEALWRRSLYTYWKRACPPPSLLTFDAPTREFCTVRRGITNTPLQALVLWNDEQFVEAARRLAERELLANQDDTTRLQAMYLRATGGVLRGDALAVAELTLRSLQQRYLADPDAATALIALGDRRPDATLVASELAAWTLLASAFLDLDATVYLD